MCMYNYPASISYDESAACFEISFRDIKNLHSVAYSEDDIELQAKDALTAAIADLIDCRIPIPEPSVCREGEILIRLPVLTCLKAALNNAMIQTGTRKADLARKLNMKGPQIDRLLDVEHASRVETLEQALFLLGQEVNISVTAA